MDWDQLRFLFWGIGLDTSLKYKGFPKNSLPSFSFFRPRGSRTKPAETSPLLWEKRPKPIQSKNFGMIPDDFWPTKKELLKTRPYLADPSTGHPLCSFVRDPNEVLDILDRSWRKPFTVSNYQFFHDLLAWYQKSWTFHMVGERFFGFWSDCFWILPTISPFESWMYLCFLVNIKKINSIFPRTFASCSITHHHHPFRWCLLTVSGSVFFFLPLPLSPRCAEVEQCNQSFSEKKFEATCRAGGVSPTTGS